MAMVCHEMRMMTVTRTDSGQLSGRSLTVLPKTRERLPCPASFYAIRPSEATRSCCSTPAADLTATNFAGERLALRRSAQNIESYNSSDAGRR